MVCTDIPIGHPAYSPSVAVNTHVVMVCSSNFLYLSCVLLVASHRIARTIAGVLESSWMLCLRFWEIQCPQLGRRL